MLRGLRATGRDFVLTVEGTPSNAYCSSTGLCGNAKRVGHDIRPLWSSMISLVDIGSGLWPFAHNATNATVQGWYNDLDVSTEEDAGGCYVGGGVLGRPPPPPPPDA